MNFQKRIYIIIILHNNYDFFSIFEFYIICIEKLCGLCIYNNEVIYDKKSYKKNSKNKIKKKFYFQKIYYYIFENEKKTSNIKSKHHHCECFFYDDVIY